ncbi:MAG: cyclic nucleotide-binding domain-containing protein [Candidatus Sericytochromatia bacterium]|nr:cyclic nucleotide-binding domain-containing protein [Candidatus Sericytochromatia bacterium]
MTETLTPQSQISIFADFLDEEVYIIGQFAEQVAVPAGDDVFAAGTNVRSLHVVIEGALQARIQPAAGDEVVVGEIQPGDVFGELSFLDGLVRTATVRCVANAVLLRVSRHQFDRLQGEYPTIAAKLMGDLALVLALRLRAADAMIAGLSAKANR